MQLARAAMHQLQWLAAIEELQSDFAAHELKEFDRWTASAGGLLAECPHRPPDAGPS